MQTNGKLGRSFANLAFAFFFMLLLSVPACADPITFSFSGTGSGTVGSQSFANAPYSIVLIGDTGNVYSVGGIDSGTHYYTGSMTITIAGIGATTISGATAVGCSYVLPARNNCAAYASTSPSGSTFFLNVAPFFSGVGCLGSAYALSCSPGLSNFVAVASGLGPVTMTSSSNLTISAAQSVAVAAPAVSVFSMTAMVLLIFLLAWQRAGNRSRIESKGSCFKIARSNRIHRRVASNIAHAGCGRVSSSKE